MSCDVVRRLAYQAVEAWLTQQGVTEATAGDYELRSVQGDPFRVELWNAKGMVSAVEFSISWSHVGLRITADSSC